ncbi:nickel-dependent lactate racemase family protein [Adhaeretor mobilis]|uniref:LarA-like N-terminal domain-containing protein n=1 Tax=Adhaeretor mobilis TaxID=1930276 RepID=A0A517MSP2_9BACT|nr:hypothetical protein [Adhaeretor mobilis]QDS97906.1 hypothetical protein HG15A2_11740 [Adhaeretor mobilis]
MSLKIHYGEQNSCQLSSDTVSVVEPSDAKSLPKIAEAVRAGLAKPIGFPPLVDTTVPGDTVAVAVSQRIPQAEQVVLGAIAALMDAGVEPRDIAVVTTVKFSDEATLTQGIDELSAGGVQFVLHEPHKVSEESVSEGSVSEDSAPEKNVTGQQEEATAMVGIMSDDQPLRFHRIIAEADFVLPIGLSEPQRAVHAEATMQASKFASLYPEFSDAATIARFSKNQNKPAPKSREKLYKQQEESGWLLGVLCIVQVVASKGNDIAAVFAGDAIDVTKAATQHSEAAWCPVSEQQADLVIAAVSGTQQQTWQNVAQAIHAAERLVSPGGAIAILTELKEKPRGGLRRLRNADDLAEVQRKLVRDEDEYAGPALQLAQALENGPVFLMSKLPLAEVESLGITPIANETELQRLVSNHDKTIVIEEAHRLVPRLAGDASATSN